MLLYMKVNLATKSKTLYETLGVAPNATHNEIKSAYYELTLQYHPDKNKSESAKAMFHEISNAYNILSKYETRMQYDRSLKIKQHDLYHPTQEKDKSTKVKKRRPKNVINTSHASRQNIYNFDTWLDEHYSYTFKESMKIKAKRMQSKPSEESYFEVITVTCSMTLSLIYLIYKKYTKAKKSQPKDD
ncbi:unnamed protein product [Xylocopa violacea]|uniref:J domain-containing protein n=1 Tax=Xylocopa violacea TaxID=135666 RepID=A0ABP1P9P7_XYLVO